ncbi:MAG: APC family permease [Clostridiales bacterium]|nr:APC family permease [Clostridiales bacterium]
MGAPKKKIGLMSVIATSTGLIVATSCLLTLGQGAGAIGATFIFSMMIACILNMMAFASLCELNSLMPNLRGGMGQYTYAALGALPAVICIFGGYVTTNCFTSSTEVSMCGIVFEEFFSWGVPPFVVGIIIILFLGIVNLLGIDIFARVQNVVAWTLLGSLLVLGVIGIMGKGMGVQVEQPLVEAGDIGSVLAVVPMAFWLFIGMDQVIPMAGEIKNPKKNLPLGIFLGLGIVFVLMVVMVFGFHNYVPWAELGSADSPHIIYGVQILGQGGIVWMGIVAILAAISTVNVVIGAISRIMEGMAQTGLVPAIFAKRNSKNMPFAGIILMMSGLILVLCIFQAADAEGLIILILTGCTFWMISFVISHVNVLVLRKKMPDAPRSFKLPFGPVIPVVGIIGMIWMIANIDPDPDFRMIIWRTVIIAMVLYVAYAILWIKLKQKRPLFHTLPVEEIMEIQKEFEDKNEAEWKAKLAAKGGGDAS